MIETKLYQIFKPEYIFMNIKPSQATKREALKLISKLCASKCGFDANTLLNKFLVREEMGSTVIDKGIAVPHTILSDLDIPIIAIARFKDKIYWDSNEALVEVAIILIMPKNFDKNIYINVLAAFARKLIHKEFITALKNIETENELYQFIIQEIPLLQY